MPDFTNFLPDFARGSTIKKVYEEMSLNIANQSFADLEMILRKRRNLEKEELVKKFKGQILYKDAEEF